MIDTRDNEFVAIMGSDRACVEAQLNNPKNAKLIKDIIQHCMIYPTVLMTPREQAEKIMEGVIPPDQLNTNLGK